MQTTTASMLIAELLLDLGNRCPDDPAPDMQVFVIAAADFDPDGWSYTFHRCLAPANLLAAHKLAAEKTAEHTSHRTVSAEQMLWDIIVDYAVARGDLSSYHSDAAQNVEAQDFCEKVCPLMDFRDRSWWQRHGYFATNVNPFMLKEPV